MFSYRLLTIRQHFLNFSLCPILPINSIAEIPTLFLTVGARFSLYIFLLNSSYKTTFPAIWKSDFTRHFAKTFCELGPPSVRPLDCLEHDASFFGNYDMKRQCFRKPFHKVTLTTRIPKNGRNTAQKMKFSIRDFFS